MESVSPEKYAERRMRSLMCESWMGEGMFVNQLEEWVVYKSWRCWWMVIGMVEEVLGCSF